METKMKKKKKKKTLAYDLDGRIFSLKSQALLRVAAQFASTSALGYVCFEGKQNKENILHPTACWVDRKTQLN